MSDSIKSEIGESLTLQESREHIISNVMLQIQSNINGEQSPVLWLSGPPGLGKSEFCEQFCRELNWGLSICFLSQMTIDMLSGMPLIKVHDLEGTPDKFVPWSIPEVFNMKNMKIKPPYLKDEEGNDIQFEVDEKGNFKKDNNHNCIKCIKDKEGKPRINKSSPIILFLDDAQLCDRGIQKYMFQLLGTKTIHKHTLPVNVAIVLAGNRSEDKAGFQQLLAPISNRIRYVDLRYDVKEWIENFAIRKHVRTDIITFIDNNPSYISGTPLESAPWPSPRSWTYASLELNQFEEMGFTLNATNTFHIVKGCVGKEFATSFYQYRELLMKWEAAKILQGEKNVVEYKKDSKQSNDIIIENLSRIDCYALISATIGELVKNLRAEKFKPTAGISKQINVFRIKILKPLTKKFREMIPLGLKLLFEGEKEFDSTVITRQLLIDDDIVKLVSGLFK